MRFKDLEAVRLKLANSVLKTYGELDIEIDLKPHLKSTKSEYGDLTSEVAFAIADKLKQPLAEVAANVVKGLDLEFGSWQELRGYINLELHDDFFIDSAPEINSNLESIESSIIIVPPPSIFCHGFSYLRLLSLVALQEQFLNAFKIPYQILSPIGELKCYHSLAESFKNLLQLNRLDQISTEAERTFFETEASKYKTKKIFIWCHKQLWGLPELKSKEGWNVRLANREWFYGTDIKLEAEQLLSWGDKDLSVLISYLVRALQASELSLKLSKANASDNLHWFLNTTLERFTKVVDNLDNSLKRKSYFLGHRMVLAGIDGRPKEFVEELEEYLWLANQVLNKNKTPIHKDNIQKNLRMLGAILGSSAPNFN